MLVLLVIQEQLHSSEEAKELSQQLQQQEQRLTQHQQQVNEEEARLASHKLQLEVSAPESSDKPELAAVTYRWLLQLSSRLSLAAAALILSIVCC